MADVPRAPSRIGFMRPPLRRQNDSLRMERNRFADIYEDDFEEEEETWGRDGTESLVYPSDSHSSDHEDFGDMDTPPLLKPSLPSHTISISCVPVQLMSHTYSSTTDLALTPPAAEEEDDGPVIPDHGLSRSALMHLKEFWSARRNEWTRKESVLGLSRSGTTGFGYGLSLRGALFSRFAAASTSLQTPAPITQDNAVSHFPPIPNTPIYPRTGDLTRLRDARFATIDRAFGSLPLYSITKTLFLHDMLARSSVSVSSASSLSSRSSSPAPESTETDDATEESVDTDTGADIDGDGRFVDISLSSSRSLDGKNDNEPITAKQLQREAGKDVECSSNVEDEHAPEADSPREWEVDWSARWRVLLHQTRSSSSIPLQQHANVDEPALIEALHSVALDPSVPSRFSSSPSPSPSPTRARFFIPAEDDEDEYFNSYDVDDDEEDYGRLLRRPVLQYGAETDYFPVYDTEFAMVHY